MAIESLCGKLRNGQDASCVAPVRSFSQQMVIINKTDIDTMTITTPTADSVECVYNVAFALKEGKSGFRFTGSSNGNTYKGFFDKSQSDLGFAQYAHSVQMLVVGSDEEAMCILDALGKGRYIGVLQIGDTIMVYGAQNGLVAGDYTYDVAEGGGGAPIVLASSENAPESLVPLVYKSATPGSEVEDFDANFSNETPSV